MYHSKSNLHKYNTNIRVVVVDVAKFFRRKAILFVNKQYLKKVHTT